MPENIKVIWIDDDKYTSNAESEAAAVERDNLIVEMIGPYEIDTISTNDADIFMIDYKLGQHPPLNHDPAFQYSGVSISMMLRDISKARGIPIYLVSRIIEGKHTNSKPELVDRCIARSTVASEGSHILYNDAIDYRKIRAAEKDSIDALVNLLKAPSADREQVISALPKDISNGMKDAGHIATGSTPSEITFGKWTTFDLLGKPGVLYDDLYAATFLGIDLNYFRTHKADVLPGENNELIYSGIFSETTPRKWWKQSLANHIVRNAPADMSITHIWVMAPNVLEIPPESLAKCFVCGESSPETVGMDRHDNEEYHPVHIKCSEPNPDITQLFPFEHPRLLNE